ncbi:hypothetical protein [Peribacillus glennii]|uniref:DUF4352 domain-containing protein n=1 Tax=Peribacillus glennii TaxID=2303991 RepID=A0A372L8R2_9BACI|nr:hypothetical protein [Peribacillus glennii]RFU61305.1 hypothetical protein D0466_19030 [Peribacillus glennii]
MTIESQVNKVKVPFYKKWWVTLIAGIVIGGAIFGGGSNEATETDTKITDEKETTETAATEPKKEEKPAPKPVEKALTKVWENEQVIISFKEVSSEGMKFLVENKTDKTILIQGDSVAVNGFSSSDLTMSDPISPKSKGYAVAQTTELADAGEPTKVSGNLRVIDNDSYDTVNATFTDVPVK